MGDDFPPQALTSRRLLTRAHCFDPAAFAPVLIVGSDRSRSPGARHGSRGHHGVQLHDRIRSIVGPTRSATSLPAATYRRTVLVLQRSRAATS